MASTLWLIGLYCVSQFVNGIPTGCKELLITGPKHHPQVSGIYKYTDVACHGKETYKQISGPNYMYYYHAKDVSMTTWQVGPVVCSRDAILSVNDTAKYPQEIRGIWHEYPEGNIRRKSEISRTISVTCFVGFAGCETLSIKNSPSSMAGAYILRPDLSCYGRYTYTHSSDTYYLYHHHGYWTISHHNCDPESDIKSQDEALYPEDISSPWVSSKYPKNVDILEIDSIKIDCSKVMSLSFRLCLAVSVLVILFLVLGYITVNCKGRLFSLHRLPKHNQEDDKPQADMVPVAPPPYPGTDSSTADDTPPPPYTEENTVTCTDDVILDTANEVQPPPYETTDSHIRIE